MQATTTSIGALGEAVAIDFLKAHGFKIRETNFRRPYGELDIIAYKELLVFVEVKSIRCEIPNELPRDGMNEHRPEENVGREKQLRLRRIIEAYLATHPTDQWRLDVLCVYLDEVKRTARVKRIENVIV